MAIPFVSRGNDTSENRRSRVFNSYLRDPYPPPDKSHASIDPVLSILVGARSRFFHEFRRLENVAVESRFGYL